MLVAASTMRQQRDRFDIVPLGTNNDAAKQVRSAASASSALTVGSAETSSPTSALALQRAWPRSGRVTVWNADRSIHCGSRITAHRGCITAAELARTIDVQRPAPSSTRVAPNLPPCNRWPREAAGQRADQHSVGTRISGRLAIAAVSLREHACAARDLARIGDAQHDLAACCRPPARSFRVPSLAKRQCDSASASVVAAITRAGVERHQRTHAVRKRR